VNHERLNLLGQPQVREFVWSIKVLGGTRAGCRYDYLKVYIHFRAAITFITKPKGLKVCLELLYKVTVLGHQLALSLEQVMIHWFGLLHLFFQLAHCVGFAIY
jgi:hypothetical protein